MSPSEPNLDDLLNEIEQKSSAVDHSQHLSDDELKSLDADIDLLKKKRLDKVDENRQWALEHAPCLRILVVDDSVVVRMQIKKSFIGYNVAFDEAECGPDAKDILEHAHDYDLITLDLNLPIMSGHEIIEHFKDLKLPFVVISTESEQATITDALAKGAISYLTKPYGPKDAKEVITHALLTKGIDLENYRS